MNFESSLFLILTLNDDIAFRVKVRIHIDNRIAFKVKCYRLRETFSGKGTKNYDYM